MEAEPDRLAVFEVRGLSHPGLVRPHNEDAWFADAHTGLALAADGVGGHASGAVASKIVVETMGGYIRRAHHLLKRAPWIDDPARVAAFCERVVQRAIQVSHARLLRFNRRATEARKQAGATVVGLWAPFGSRSVATVFHVGDSRLYRLQPETATQLTRDHSVYERWAQSGKTGPAPGKNYILQAVGAVKTISPEIRSFSLSAGDRFLACTDGLSSDLAGEDLVSAIAGSPSLGAACDRLIALGLSRGGKDNITVVMLSF
jgi:serine/threonine protein phosphatase PrpC